MQTTQRSEVDLTTPQNIFNTATITVGGLYLATHSVAVTLIGAGAASLLTCWTLWLSHKRNAHLPNRTDQRPTASQTVQPHRTPGAVLTERRRCIAKYEVANTHVGSRSSITVTWPECC